jgi:hypothetical protein
MSNELKCIVCDENGTCPHWLRMVGSHAALCDECEDLIAKLPEGAEITHAVLAGDGHKAKASLFNAGRLSQQLRGNVCDGTGWCVCVLDGDLESLSDHYGDPPVCPGCEGCAQDEHAELGEAGA